MSNASPTKAAAAEAAAVAEAEAVLGVAAKGADGEGAEGGAALKGKKAVQSPRGNVKLRELTNNQWTCVLPAGMTLDDVEAPGVFALVGDLLQPFDILHLCTSDRTAWGELLVLDAGAGFVDVRLLRREKLPPRLDTGEVRMPAGFAIRRAGPSDSQPGFLVVRLSDGRLLNAELHIHRREEAIRFLLDHATVRPEKGTSYLP